MALGRIIWRKNAPREETGTQNQALKHVSIEVMAVRGEKKTKNGKEEGKPRGPGQGCLPKEGATSCFILLRAVSWY